VKMPRFTGPAQAAVGALLLIVLMLPPLRHALEAGMRQHMLLQFPALMLAGALLARGLPPAMGRRLARWNAMGIAGLTAGALFMAVLMIPRALDLALVDARVEAVKVVALLLAGAVLESSWRAAGLVVQAFFVGSVVPMAIVVGTLFQDSPLRLCNAYRLDDQQRLGTELVWIAAVVGVSWLLQAIWRSISSESVGARRSRIPHNSRGIKSR
jgi:hypothetical protein